MTMESKSKSAANQTYAEGEKVLCYHGNLAYEAKIIQIRNDGDKNQNYKIHYQGWNKNWDDWVATDRLLKWNNANLELKRKLELEAKKIQSEQRKSKAKKRESQASVPGDDASSTTSTPSTPVAPATGTKENRQQQSASVIAEPPPELVPLRPETKIKVPEELRSWLIDDQAAIKNKKLSVLPASPTIATIFQDYVQQKRNSKLSIDRELMINEMTRGLGLYFNSLLGGHLLYKFERPQYQSILEERGNETDLTTIYGVVHLVRMFPRLPFFLSHAYLDEKSLTSIISYVHDMLRWLSKNTSYYDPNEYYQVAPPEYLK